MRARTNVLAILFVVGSVAYTGACETIGLSRPPTASLRTDSTQIGARRSGFAVFAKIGFTYTNTTSNPVSKAGCGGPQFPALEKKVNDRWVAAYYPIYLMCLTKPDFMIPSGQSFHSELQFEAYEPGHHTGPELLVGSIDGIYRLRWDLVQGTDATVRGAKSVIATSNEFRMVLNR